MKVYLAGAIELVGTARAREWREQARRDSEYFDNLICVDPMDYESPEGPYYDEQIVNTDKALLSACDAILLDGRQPGWGSAMEVALAHGQHIPVVVWGLDRDKASIWLRHHATSFHDTLGEAIEQLYALSGAL